MTSNSLHSLHSSLPTRYAKYQREQEMYGNRALHGDEKAKLGLSLMYDPPLEPKKNKTSSGDEIANVNFFYKIAHVEASAYVH